MLPLILMLQRKWNKMFTPLDMTSLYKNEFDWGWITKDILKTYVEMGILSAEGYRKITGDDYVQATQAQQA